MAIYTYAGARDPEGFLLAQTALDPDRRIEARTWEAIGMADPVLLDVGAGNGLLSVRFAARARHVYALEPDPGMLVQIHASLAAAGGAAGRVSVLAASADAIPLAEASVDVVHARYAYFFGTDACLPGLAEARRVLRPGGCMVVLEGSNQAEMGRINAKLHPHAFADQEPVLDFWRRQGFEHQHLLTTWRVPDRATMHRVFAFEFGDAKATEVVAGIAGCELSYGTHLFRWRKPGAS